MENIYKVIIFDFDGVLMNTHLLCYDIHLELNPDLSYQSFQDMSNGNFIYAVSEAKEKGEFINNPEFYKKYQEGACNHDVPELLRKIILESDKLFFIVSSGNKEIITGELKRSGLIDKFTDIYGEEFHVNKTHKILHILETFKLKGDEALFVTDTLGDIIEGNKAGVDVCGVTWGLHDRDRLITGSPKYIIDSEEELGLILNK